MYSFFSWFKIVFFFFWQGSNAASGLISAYTYSYLWVCSGASFWCFFLSCHVCMLVACNNYRDADGGHGRPHKSRERDAGVHNCAQHTYLWCIYMHIIEQVLTFVRLWSCDPWLESVTPTVAASWRTDCTRRPAPSFGSSSSSTPRDTRPCGMELDFWHLRGEPGRSKEPPPFSEASVHFKDKAVGREGAMHDACAPCHVIEAVGMRRDNVSCDTEIFLVSLGTPSLIFILVVTTCVCH